MFHQNATLQRVTWLLVASCTLVTFTLLVVSSNPSMSYIIWPYYRNPTKNAVTQSTKHDGPTYMQSNSLPYLLNESYLVTDNDTADVVEGATILMWTRYYGSKDPFRTWWSQGKDYCKPEHRGCRFTDDQAELVNATAVLFYCRDVNSQIRLPRLKPNQRAGCPDKIHNAYYQWTMTYHTKSTVHFYEPRLHRWDSEVHGNESYNKVLMSLNTKRHPIAWFVSNCASSSARELYVAKLKLHIDVQIYGACNGKKCPKSQMSQCLQMLGANYYFYLAFENSLCEDYVSEKLWNAIEAGVIPIVLRRKIAEPFLPPESFIAVDDFSGPKQLAVHLKHLISNPIEYLTYFEWRRTWRLTKNMADLCKLCALANDVKFGRNNHQSLSQKNLYAFWEKGTNCELVQLHNGP